MGKHEHSKHAIYAIIMQLAGTEIYSHIVYQSEIFRVMPYIAMNIISLFMHYWIVESRTTMGCYVNSLLANLNDFFENLNSHCY